MYSSSRIWSHELSIRVPEKRISIADMPWLKNKGGDWLTCDFDWFTTTEAYSGKSSRYQNLLIILLHYSNLGSLYRERIVARSQIRFTLNFRHRLTHCHEMWRPRRFSDLHKLYSCRKPAARMRVHTRLQILRTPPLFMTLLWSVIVKVMHRPMNWIDKYETPLS